MLNEGSQSMPPTGLFIRLLKETLPANIVPQISSRQIVLVKQEPVAVQTTQTKPIKVSGKLTDLNGEAIIGAAILVAGTTNGAITEVDGTYILNNVPSSATLRITYVGYITQEIPVDGRTKIDLVLEEEALALDEVVVIGYGTQKKSDVTGSISVVKSEDLRNRSASNAASALQVNRQVYRL